MGKTDLVSFGQIFEKKGALSLIEAEPSVGKTGIGLYLLLSVAEEDKPCLFISIEIDEEGINNRLLGVASGIDIRKISTGHLSQKEKAELSNTKSHLASLPLIIESSMPSPSLSDVITLIERLHNEGKTDIAIIDYLHLVNPEGRDSLKELKALAEKLDIAVIALHQIPRGSGEVIIDSPYIDNSYCLKRERGEARDAILVNLKDEENVIKLYYDPYATKFSVI